MPLDLEKLGNIFGQDTIKKIYEDGASPAVQEMGKALADFAKTFRLFTAPIQLLASYQDRLSRHLEKVRNSVKEENQVEAPASISGPIIERLKYLDETNYLTRLYLNLLSRAIDSERISEAHPAFYHIIDQLSSDEAILLYFAKQSPIEVTVLYPLVNTTGRISFEQSFPTLPSNIKEKMSLPQHLIIYADHLQTLGLITSKGDNNSAARDIPHHVGTYMKSQIVLTPFGRLFAQACIPDTEHSL